MRSKHVVPLAVLAAVAFLNAQAIGQLLGAALTPDVEMLTGPPARATTPEPNMCPAVHGPSARAIVERNPFDHASGSLAKRAARPSRKVDGAPAVSSEPTTPSDPAESPGELTIDRELVEKMLQDQASLARQARAVPVREDGRIVGVRLTGIRSDGLLGRLGIQNGDEVLRVNGFEVGTPDKALAAYAQLAHAKRLHVQLRRGGAIVHLGYRID